FELAGLLNHVALRLVVAVLLGLILSQGDHRGKKQNGKAEDRYVKVALVQQGRFSIKGLV
ncbi:MAG: hypothetical protein R3236_10680, partial [Phycisphaeraceae bacterium]|nr:hypothetical protein [Phycisphaeraceae bacterium]